MTDSQEEDSLNVQGPGVGGRQARRTLGCQPSHTTPMSGRSASRLGTLSLKLINKSVNKGNLPTLILSIQDLSDLIIFAQTQNRMPHSLPGDAGG